MNRRYPKTAVATLLLIVAVSARADAEAQARLLVHDKGERNAEVFEAAWNTVNDRYFDPEFRGVDWQAVRRRFGEAAAAAESRDELSAVINGMLAELATSHTAHYTPTNPLYYIVFDVYARNPVLDEHRQRIFGDADVRVDGIGIYTAEIDGKVFIDGVVEDTPADRAGLQFGDEIVSAGRAPFHPIRSFLGKAGQEVELLIRRTEQGEPFVLSSAVESINPASMFEAAVFASAQVMERQGKKIGYVHFWSSAGPQYRDALEQLRQGGPLSDVDAIVIDMRGKVGGGGMSFLEVLDPRGPDLAFSGRGFSGESPASLRNKTVWLVDDSVRSSAELLAHTIRADGYGTLVGNTTAGAVVGGSAYMMPDDSLLYVAVVDLLVDGERLEGRGVAPHIQVDRPLPYASGKDAQLERALVEAVRLAASK